MVNLLKKLMEENPLVKQAEYNKTLARIGKAGYLSYSDYEKTRNLLFDLQIVPSWYFIIKMLHEDYNIKIVDGTLILGISYQTYYNWERKTKRMNIKNLNRIRELYKPIVIELYEDIIKK